MSLRRRDAHNPSPDGRYTCGVSLYRSGRYIQAIELLAELRDCAGSVGQMSRFYEGMAHRAIGVAALADGRFDQAEEHLRAAAGVIGTEADLPAYLASLYAQTGRADACRREMEKASGTCDEPNVLRKLAQAQWQSGRPAEAMMTLTAAMRRFPSEVGLHLQMGLFHAASERFDQAATALQQAVDCDCDNADAHYYLGLVFAAQRKPDAAARELQRTFALQPNNVLAGYQLAIAARAAQAAGYRVMLHPPEDNIDEATSEIRHLAACITQEPEFIDAMLSLPPSEIDHDLFELLLGVVKMALAKHPTYADLRFYCSRLLTRLEQMAEAEEQAWVALDINPAYVKALLHLSELLVGQNRIPEAVELSRRAIDCGADVSDINVRLAELIAATDSGARTDGRLDRAAQRGADDESQQDLGRRAA